jgi:1-acyl-sn-glycerol-3-phosphate acyltransferase
VVIIFPEGTRIETGQQGNFHPGIAAVYKNAGVPIVPVALNSGLFWGRGNVGPKRPGTITVEFLPAIEPGIDRRVFMTNLKTSIDEGTARLEAEARAEFPALEKI